MDATDIRGRIWSALTAAGLEVTPAGHRDRPDLRALLVREPRSDREFLVLVGEMGGQKEPPGQEG